MEEAKCQERKKQLIVKERGSCMSILPGSQKIRNEALMPINVLVKLNGFPNFAESTLRERLWEEGFTMARTVTSHLGEQVQHHILSSC